MQNIIFYVAPRGAIGTVRDYANARNERAPTLVRGCETCLRLRLFTGANNVQAYPIDEFAEISAWQFAFDADFKSSTDYILQADDANIAVSTVEETIAGVDYAYTEFEIPLQSMNTEELVRWLANEKSKSGLIGELVGVNGDGEQVFVLQVEDFTVRNRVISAGDTTPIESDYLNATQVRGLIASGLDLQFSADGEEWHDTQTDDDKHFRIRSSSTETAIWSEAITLFQGPKGEEGTIGNMCKAPVWLGPRHYIELLDDKPVIMNTTENTSAAMTIPFDGRVKYYSPYYGENMYYTETNLPSSKKFTYEYHVNSSVTITSFTTKRDDESYEFVKVGAFPSYFPLVGANTDTTHVFELVIYKNSVGVTRLIRYKYSYKTTQPVE